MACRRNLVIWEMQWTLSGTIVTTTWMTMSGFSKARSQPPPAGTGTAIKNASVSDIVALTNNRDILGPGKYRRAFMWVDGAARNNANGHAGAGIQLRLQSALFGMTVTENFAEYLGVRSNNEAEYLALMFGLQIALAHGVNDLTVHSDSALVVNQLNKQYNVRSPTLGQIYDQCEQFIHHFSEFELTYVPRYENEAADSLANDAIDERRLDITTFYNRWTRRTNLHRMPVLDRNANTNSEQSMCCQIVSTAN